MGIEGINTCHGRPPPRQGTRPPCLLRLRLAPPPSLPRPEVGAPESPRCRHCSTWQCFPMSNSAISQRRERRAQPRQGGTRSLARCLLGMGWAQGRSPQVGAGLVLKGIGLILVPWVLNVCYLGRLVRRQEEKGGFSVRFSRGRKSCRPVLRKISNCLYGRLRACVTSSVLQSESRTASQGLFVVFFFLN